MLSSNIKTQDTSLQSPGNELLGDFLLFSFFTLTESYFIKRVFYKNTFSNKSNEAHNFVKHERWGHLLFENILYLCSEKGICNCSSVTENDQFHQSIPEGRYCEYAPSFGVYSCSLFQCIRVLGRTSVRWISVGNTLFLFVESKINGSM